MSAAVKLTPLHAAAQQREAQFVEYQGWLVAEAYTTVGAEVAAAREGVVLADETPNGKLTVEGLEAEAVIQAAFGLSGLTVGDGDAVEMDHVYRLRNDLFFIRMPPGGEGATLKSVTASVQEAGLFVTVTNVTHGRSEIRVIGPASRALMRKVCGLDFYSEAFPDGAARQSSVAKTTQLVIRRDIGPLTAFSIIGARSLGAYLWDILLESGQELGVVPVGRAALQALEAS
jgi:heterotetrameric sarcosine oxidase gamma subunit